MEDCSAPQVDASILFVPPAQSWLGLAWLNLLLNLVRAVAYLQAVEPLYSV